MPRRYYAGLSPYGQAVILALCGYFLFSVADISAKLLTSRHPTSVTIFLPSFIAMLGVGARVLYERGWAGFKTTRLKLQLMRGVVITALVVLCVNAVKLIPLADYYSIIFLTPFLVMTLSIFLYKEPVHPQRILVLIMSFIGVLVTIGPHFNSLNIGYLYVALAILMSASNVFLVRKIARDEYAPLFGFFPLLGVVVFSAPFAIPDMAYDFPVGDIGYFLLYGIALIGAHTFLPMAFSRTPMVSRLTPLHYSQMVWGILAGYIIFDAPFEINTIIGGGLIVGSGLWLFFVERKVSRTPL